MTSVDLGPGLRYRDHYRRGFRAGLPWGLGIMLAGVVAVVRTARALKFQGVVAGDE